MTHIIEASYISDSYFMDWLLDVTKLECQAAIKPHKLVLLNEHILTDNIFNFTDSQKHSFNIYREMLRIVRSLRWRKVKDYYIIYIPSNVFITSTNIPLSKLSRFVCYGDLTVKGYPILSDVIQGVIANIAKYINRYERLFYGGV